ncbi:SGNH hydrolase-type esterase domain-containing protein [Leptodontidium sp. 2 PMI_412]|nr:SGNH hydrolase-type esterase domain-containing protein [Leptodontidium sp. 2 PMI_412]
MSTSNPSESQRLPPELMQQLLTIAKFKERSHTTCHETHLPELSQTKSLDVVLLGDSMIERFKTTGINTQTFQLPNSFNAGVGGDKIENIIYRLLIMLPLLPSDIKLWVVMAGTNNLKKTSALKNVEIESYKLLVQALCYVAPGSRVCVCGLFGRRYADVRWVEETNGLLRGMVEELGERVSWLESPSVEAEVHLVDHVHLNEVGYGIWDGVLCERIKMLLG